MRLVFLPFAALLMLSPPLAIPQQGSPSAAAVVTVACRALETYTDEELKVTVIVFHQRDEAQRSQLAALLHDHSGQIVEIQVGEGKWRRARVMRLKSCFGRGLLLLPAPVPISEHAEFKLRLPADSEAH